MKLCSHCKQVKPLSEFTIEKRFKTGSGFGSWCKPCQAKKSALYRATRLSKQHRREWAAGQRQKIRNDPSRLAKRREDDMARYHKKKATIGFRARLRVKYAVENRRLRRPDKCSRCGVPCYAEAHHPDYSKPLEVIWLCRLCHAEIHPGKARAALGEEASDAESQAAETL